MDNFHAIVSVTSSGFVGNVQLFTFSTSADSIVEAESELDLEFTVSIMGGEVRYNYNGHVMLTEEKFNEIQDEIPEGLVGITEANEWMNKVRGESGLSTGEQLQS